MEITRVSVDGDSMNAVFILLVVFLFVFLAATGKWKAVMDVVKNPPQ